MFHDISDVRAAHAEEADETLRVLCAAFQLPYDAASPIYYGDPFYDLSQKRVLRTPRDGIVSCLTLVPLQIRIGHAWVPMAGIAGVATRPDHQRQGYAGHLLAATVSALTDEFTYPVTGLFANSESLYRRIGWETATTAVTQSLSLSASPALSGAAFARLSQRDDVEDAAAVQRLYAAAVKGRTGGFARDERRWQLIHAVPTRQRLVYQRPGEAVNGYAYWEKTGDTVRLLEIIGQTADALQGLAAAVQAQPGRRLDWPTAPSMMLRITDVNRALQVVHEANLAPILSGLDRSLTLTPIDEYRPDNNLPIRLTSAGIEPGTRTDRDTIILNIRVLAQIYLGYLSPSEAAHTGDISASSSEALTLADALFPRRSPYIALLDQF